MLQHNRLDEILEGLVEAGTMVESAENLITEQLEETPQTQSLMPSEESESKSSDE